MGEAKVCVLFQVGLMRGEKRSILPLNNDITFVQPFIPAKETGKAYLEGPFIYQTIIYIGDTFESIIFLIDLECR